MAERSIAHFAHVGPQLLVFHHDVCRESARRFKSRIAEVARERFSVRMSAHVLLNACFLVERLLANPALERLLVGVYPKVLVDGVARFRLEIAERAEVVLALVENRVALADMEHVQPMVLEVDVADLALSRLVSLLGRLFRVLEHPAIGRDHRDRKSVV